MLPGVIRLISPQSGVGLGEAAAQALVGARQLRAVVEHHAAGRRDVDAARAPDHQQAELVLQVSQVLADRRLGEPEPLGRAREVAGLDQHLEGSQPLRIERRGAGEDAGWREGHGA